MEKESKYTITIAILIVLLAASVLYSMNSRVTGQATTDYGAVVWLKPYEELDADIYIDGELYKSVRQMGRERLKLDPGTYDIKVVDEKGRIYEETVSLKSMDSLSIYIQHPLVK